MIRTLRRVFLLGLPGVIVAPAVLAPRPAPAAELPEPPELVPEDEEGPGPELETTIRAVADGIIVGLAGQVHWHGGQGEEKLLRVRHLVLFAAPLRDLDLLPSDGPWPTVRPADIAPPFEIDLQTHQRIVIVDKDGVRPSVAEVLTYKGCTYRSGDVEISGSGLRITVADGAFSFRERCC
jgi:hypothetical protein